MPSPTTAADLLALAAKCGILPENTVPPEAKSETKADRCAAVLVRSGKLTHFQAKNLLGGKHRGLVLGPYRLQSPLGQGGMGSVYLAEHGTLKRQVALKVLPPTLAKDQLARERFFREARSAASLDHPNIVRLHDVSEHNGVKYLVMEYVIGTDLGSLIEKAGRLPAPVAAGYIIQAANGLRHAHTKGFVHRDIKPANLIVTSDETVKILDMGLTRRVDDQNDALTQILGQAGDAAGSIDFASPEQAMGESVDQRSDIYSLGATFVAMLTGKPPYEGTTAQKLMMHQLGAVPDLNKLPGVVPPGLADVIRKMMAKKPSDRYENMTALIAAVMPYVEAGTATMRPLTTKPRKTKWIAAAAAVIVLAGGGIALLTR
jgi:eukaryotic-like serine/threonine-protein kinase